MLSGNLERWLQVSSCSTLGLIVRGSRTICQPSLSSHLGVTGCAFHSGRQLLGNRASHQTSNHITCHDAPQADADFGQTNFGQKKVNQTFGHPDLTDVGRKFG